MTARPDLDAQLGEALQAVNQGQIERALAIIDAVLALEPDYPAALDARLQLTVLLDRPAEALAAGRRLADVQPTPAGLFRLGMLEHRAGNTDAAITALDLARSLDPGFGAAHEALGQLLAGRQRFAEACAALLQADRLGALSVAGRLALANAHYGAGDRAAALAAAERVAADDPLQVEAFNTMGVLRFEAGDWPGAIAALDRTLLLQPQHLSARLNLARVLRADGHLDRAIAEYRTVATAQPGLAFVEIELAACLADRGDQPGAIEVYGRVVTADPTAVLAHVGLGDAYAALGRAQEALASFERAIALEPAAIVAYFGAYSAALLLDDEPRALGHLDAVLKRQRVSSYPARRPPERLTVLALCTPGTLVANLPVEYLVDRDHTTLHKYYLPEDPAAADPPLPAYDIAFVAIAEAEAARPALARAKAFLGAQGKPWINDPDRIRLTSRDGMAALLAGCRHALVPAVRPIDRAAIRAAGRPAWATPTADQPLLIRPFGSHAGKQLERVDDAAALDRYLAAVEAERYYVVPFVDYSGPDGYYRKYRIIFVDREPYPFHLAVSRRWMVHFYNSDMNDLAWARAEEEAFLADLGSVFHGPLRDALTDVGQAVDLDYFGIDCAIARDGRLLMFEIETGMIVHTLDRPDLYPYKAVYVPRVFQALDRLIQRKRAGG